MQPFKHACYASIWLAPLVDLKQIANGSLKQFQFFFTMQPSEPV